MESKEVRNTFVEFFKSKQHKIVSSAPMVIKNDPTLMFTNAGMNQFKDIFLGNATTSELRVANTQKCLRVSGKHNDLDEVGHDTYHHTMFEMLGNWSFGDYFKKEAIAWAWELLVSVYKIDQNRLYVTVFGGDKEDGLEPDMEAYNFWKQIIPEDRIIYGSKKDNFWEMGESGPCGPCSEVHVDLRDNSEREQNPGRDLVNMDNPEVIEIWNLVFIEFNRLSDKSLVNLPSKHVDTGMGFERLCMVLQGKKSNYDTDIFQHIIDKISSLSGKKYGVDKPTNIAMRVVADHLRAVVFSIADGQLPSNVKAGYVIRRILRRAIRYSYTFLDVQEPFMYELVPSLVDKMGEVFPEIQAQQELIMNVIREEENTFLRTLALGIKKFDNYVENNINLKKVEGAFAFELFDTYGFPIDLTRIMAKEKGWDVDMEGFLANLEIQKNRSRKAAEKNLDDWVILDDAKSNSEFVGYDTLETEATVIKYRLVKEKNKQFYQIVLDRTPFYAESGGQVGDRGKLVVDGKSFSVIDTVKENELFIHILENIPDSFDDGVIAVVDEEKRILTMYNHTATHLMHASLRQVLGTHVEQKGSLVNENYLRFDFSHFSKLTDEELLKIERIVNSRIRENIQLQESRNVPIQKAIEMGAMALFGEKYGEQVRVIVYDKDYSVELCGGTHVLATGQIGLFKIVSEGAIAAGIRRIEAITAIKAEEWVHEQSETINSLKTALKNPKELIKGVEAILEQNNLLKKELDKLKSEKAHFLKADLVKQIEAVGEINFLAAEVDLDMDTIRDLLFQLQNEANDLVVLLGNQNEGKASISLMIAKSLVEKGMDAGKMIRDIAREIQGGGGGQPHFATAGGKNPAGLDKAFEKAKAMVQSL